MSRKLGMLFLISAALVWSIAPVVAQEHAEHEHAAGEADHDHGHAHEHIGHANASPSLEQPQEVRADLALWTLVVFGLLLVILGKFAWGPIVEALEKREANIANHIAQAERNHEEAKRLLGDYETKLASAAGEVRALMDEARRDAEHAKQEILTEAKNGAEAERLRALRDIDAASDAAQEQLARTSAQLAVDLAGKILQSKLNGDDHAKLIQEAMAKFPKSSVSSN